MKFKFLFSVIFLLLGTFLAMGQTNIAITIDDVPNTRMFEDDHFESILFNKLDSANIPVAIFINEGLIYKTDAVSENFKLLNQWIQSDFTTIGNHTFSHSRYSQVGFDAFKLDIEKGAYISKELAKKSLKTIDHFRFPYNDLGKDSIQHKKIDSLLYKMNYNITPFTVESSDWMFNYIYEYYLANKDFEAAARIGDLYVKKTLEFCQFFDSLSVNIYGKQLNQIYLCHDNALNSKYLIEIINQLKEKNYSFISLDQALEASVYQQPNQYYRKWGVSWFYRWMPTQKERVKWMRQEPNIEEVELLYEKLRDGK